MTGVMGVTGTWLWVAAVAAPLATALVLWMTTLGGDSRLRTMFTKYAALAVVPSVALGLAGPQAGEVDVPWLLLGTHLSIDSIGRPLLLVTALLYAAAVIAVYSSGTERRTSLNAFLLVCFVGNAGVFVAADAVTFYLCYAVMGIAAYGLVLHDRTGQARHAGRVYLVLTLVGEMAVFAGILLTVAAGGRMLTDAPVAVAGSSQQGLIIALFVVGFGIKAGTFPLHVWLPLAHPAAPPPASAVLSGTMIKAGLVGWLRFLPLGEAALPDWGVVIVGLSLIGVFLALPAGVLQRDPKVALAYSSISQMGFLGILVGTALASPDLAEVCILAAVVYAVHHAMAKGGLFLGITVWRTHGSGWIRYWVLIGLALLALAVAGAPFGSGAVAKYASKAAVGDSTFLWFSLAAVLPLVATVSTMLLARAGWLLITGPRDRAWGVDGAVLSWTVLTVGGTMLTWYLAEQWSPAVAVPGLDPTTLWAALWPILLGAALSAAAWLLSSRNVLPAWAGHPDGSTIPPGDLLIPEERVITGVLGTLARRADAAGAVEADLWQRIGRVRAGVPAGGWVRLERIFTDWVGSGIALAVLTAGVVVVVVLAVLT